MPYPPLMVNPMRQELVDVGFEELRTAEDADRFMTQRQGSVLLFINSVCGCAAGQGRPGMRLALTPGGEEGRAQPERLVTVFAGQDQEATARVRSHFADIPPSSPSIALFQGEELVYFVPRHRIEGRTAEEVAADLSGAFQRYFSQPVRAEDSVDAELAK